MATSTLLTEPSYEWLYPNKTVTMGNTLIINDPIKRNDTGIYRCRARNKHGDRIAETVIDVQCKLRERQRERERDTFMFSYYISMIICFAFLLAAVTPRCEIERREIDDQDTLICTAYGNPEEVSVNNAYSTKQRVTNKIKYEQAEAGIRYEKSSAGCAMRMNCLGIINE